MDTRLNLGPTQSWNSKRKAVIDIQLVQVYIKTIICMHIISNNSPILKRVTKLKGVTIWKKKDLSEH